MKEANSKILARAGSDGEDEYYALDHSSCEQLPAKKQPELLFQLECIWVQGGGHG